MTTQSSRANSGGARPAQHILFDALPSAHFALRPSSLGLPKDRRQPASRQLLSLVAEDSVAASVIETQLGETGQLLTSFSTAERRQQRSPAVANALLASSSLGYAWTQTRAFCTTCLGSYRMECLMDTAAYSLPLTILSSTAWRAAASRRCLRSFLGTVAASLQDALFQCRLRRMHVYNARRDKVNSLQIHEWAAVLAIAPTASRRGLPATIGGRPLSLSPVGAVLTVVDALSTFASAAYFYPRVELDGGRACRRRLSLRLVGCNKKATLTRNKSLFYVE